MHLMAGYKANLQWCPEKAVTPGLQLALPRFLFFCQETVSFLRSQQIRRITKKTVLYQRSPYPHCPWLASLSVKFCAITQVTNFFNKIVKKLKRRKHNPRHLRIGFRVLCTRLLSVPVVSCSGFGHQETGGPTWGLALGVSQQERYCLAGLLAAAQTLLV